MPLHYCDEKSLPSTILRIEREGQTVTCKVDLKDGRFALITTKPRRDDVEEREA